jgi:hypothetical protein
MREKGDDEDRDTRGLRFPLKCLVVVAAAASSSSVGVWCLFAAALVVLVSLWQIHLFLTLPGAGIASSTSPQHRHCYNRTTHCCGFPSTRSSSSSNGFWAHVGRVSKRPAFFLNICRFGVRKRLTQTWRSRRRETDPVVTNSWRALSFCSDRNSSDMGKTKTTTGV